MSSNISFALNLGSEDGEGAILARLNSEVKVLECLRKFTSLHARASKEFSLAVAAAATGAKKSLSALPNSPLSNSSLGIVEQLGSAAGIVKEKAEILGEETLTHLNSLIGEKRNLLKMTGESYEKMKGKAEELREGVGKRRGEYGKSFGAYESARSKYEDQCGKGKGRKTEETREKFGKTLKRLNISHGEYLLALTETIEFEREFRQQLLPSLLQIQQSACERQLESWTNALASIRENSIHALQQNIEGVKEKEGIKQVDFAIEYMDLMRNHKNSPITPCPLKFEPAHVSSLPASQNRLIADSTTADFLRTKSSEFERKLRENEDQLNRLNKEEQNEKKDPNSGKLSEEVRRTEALSLKLEAERVKTMKSLIQTSLNGMSLPEKSYLLGDDSTSLLNEPTKKTKRISGFFRTPKLKKAVSFEEPPPIVPTKKVGNSESRGLVDEEWFHGVLPREDVVRLLRKDGDFLVRETTKKEERNIVLSVFWAGPKHFIVQTTSEGEFRFEGASFPTVRLLVDHYVKENLPVTNRSGAHIRKPVNREHWELNNDDVELLEKIGRGNFGDVYKASLKGTSVAVKTCKVNLPEEQKKKFLQEGRILKQYDHPNIVRFVGICVQKQPIMIVMELVPGGSLLTYLKSKGSILTIREMTGMCIDAAAGMGYLEERGCIHRDLAARNCLIGESGSVKISDFGMSREEEEYVVSDGMKQIPIKWTAPEALNYGKYTSLSDVWSYGILMWEVFSGGGTPYSGFSNSKTREMVEGGYRMPPPPTVPDILHGLMARCWSYEPESRPRFGEIHSELIVASNSELLDPPMLHSKKRESVGK